MKETFIDSKGFKILFLLLIVVIVIIVVINTVFMSESDEEENILNNGVAEENILTAEEIDENTNQLEIEDLKDKDERTRIQQYCGKFIRYIESKDYDKAYALLYPDFKTNYFPTLEDFQKYAEEKFPSTLISVEYNNIERQGKYYILFTTVKTPLDTSYSMDQKFILIENGFNDFQLSFDVKQ